MPAQAIPASQIVSVIPSVLGAGGSALDLNGLILTTSERVPIGAVQSFPDQASVAAYFGSTAQEAQLAAIYFLGFDDSTVKPGALLFAQYPTAPVPAWLRSGSVAGLTLAQLQALHGSLSVMIDGALHSAGSIDLSSATSFSAAADLIQTGLGISGLPGAHLTGQIATTVLTVSAVASGVIEIGQMLTGGATAANTRITEQLTGTPGGLGTYTVSVSQTVASGPLTTADDPVAFDSQSGSFVIESGTAGTASTIAYATGTLAIPLMMTQATGAVISQGAAAGVPATNLDRIKQITEDWATFMTTWEPSSNDKVAFAAWTNAQNNQYAYAMWSTDATPTAGTDTSSAGYLIQQAGYSGTVLIYEDSPIGDIAAFALSYPASLDTAATNGRATAMFRGQTGIAPDVIDGASSANLRGNGYNFYGDWSTRNDEFIWFANGTITGPFKWFDSYVNQIWLNNSLQLAMMSLLKAMKSIPYNQVGYTAVRAGCRDPIDAAVNFGAIRAGVPLSAQQAAEVNFAAGVKIDDVLFTRGWYLQVLDATAQVRAARGSPPISLWYMDGQSIQRINIASVLVM
jgi:hypothetical protein